MANFQVHLTGAVLSSSLLACAALKLELVSPAEVMTLWVIGTIGGILPDIDSDNSTAIAAIFSILGVILALLVVQTFASDLSIIGLWLTCLMVFAFVRYVLLNLFERFTVHRGSIHSLLACTMFGLFTVFVHHQAGADSSFAWCAGLILMAGMLVHLSLDEMYSVDFANRNIKRSFGSALKIASLEYPIASLTQLIICAILFYQLPSIKPLLNNIQHQQTPFLPIKEWHDLMQFFS